MKLLEELRDSFPPFVLQHVVQGLDPLSILYLNEVVVGVLSVRHPNPPKDHEAISVPMAAFHPQVTG
jgi:hypothetical protein